MPGGAMEIKQTYEKLCFPSENPDEFISSLMIEDGKILDYLRTFCANDIIQ